MNTFQILLLFFLIFVMIIFIIFGYLNAQKKLSNLQKIEYKEDMLHFFKENKHPLRDLKTNELIILKAKYNSLIPGVAFADYRIYIIPSLFFFVSIVPNLNSLLQKSQRDFFSIFSPGQWIILTVITSIFIYIIALISHRYKYYLDMRSPVFATIGKLYLYWGGSIESEGTYFQIRDVKINYRFYPEFAKYLNSLPEKSDIYIEFSPHTKSVWKVEKSLGQT